MKEVAMKALRYRESVGFFVKKNPAQMGGDELPYVPAIGDTVLLGDWQNGLLISWPALGEEILVRGMTPHTARCLAELGFVPTSEASTCTVPSHCGGVEYKGVRHDQWWAMVTFFDTHSGLWVSCSRFDPRAEPFGPTGSARPITDLAEVGLTLEEGESAHTAAKRCGRLIPRDEDECTSWDVLAPYPIPFPRLTEFAPMTGAEFHLAQSEADLILPLPEREFRAALRARSYNDRVLKLACELRARETAARVLSARERRLIDGVWMTHPELRG